MLETYKNINNLIFEIDMNKNANNLYSVKIFDKNNALLENSNKIAKNEISEFMREIFDENELKFIKKAILFFKGNKIKVRS